MGIKQKKFWKLTPYELYLENQAFEMRFKRENILNLRLLNTVSGFLGGTALDFDDIFNYKSLKDYKLRSIESFRVDDKIDFEEWNKYLEEVIIPAKIELGMEV